MCVCVCACVCVCVRVCCADVLYAHTGDCDLEFEANEERFANAAPAFAAGQTGVLGVCDRRERALCFYAMALEGLPIADAVNFVPLSARPPPPAAAPPVSLRSVALAERRFSKIDLQQLMQDVSPTMALYISIQQYRQTLDAQWRRTLALRIRAEFFPEAGPVGVGIPFEMSRAMRELITHLRCVVLLLLLLLLS